MIENMIKAFKLSFEDYDAVEKSKHWKKFDERKHLYSIENLENFRNNTLSDGLDDRYSIDDQKKIFSKLINEIGINFIYKNLNKINIGNCKQIFFYNDKIVDTGQLFHIKWLHDLNKFVFNKSTINVIVEIGGGYGSFAEKIIKSYDCKYIIIDLPEANLISSYYLSKHFPDKKIILVTDLKNKKLLNNDLNKGDIFILPPWYSLEVDKVDLFINTRSFMEMNLNIIKKYFKIIQTKINNNGFFFNINRYHKDSVGESIRFYDYPYDKKWEIIYSKPSFLQEWIHQMITRRNLNLDNNNSFVNKELLSLIKKTKNFESNEKKIKKIKILKKILFPFFKILEKVIGKTLSMKIKLFVKKFLDS
jgi:hypothetical protein